MKKSSVGVVEEGGRETGVVEGTAPAFWFCLSGNLVIPLLSHFYVFCLQYV